MRPPGTFAVPKLVFGTEERLSEELMSLEQGGKLTVTLQEDNSTTFSAVSNVLAFPVIVSKVTFVGLLVTPATQVALVTLIIMQLPLLVSTGWKLGSVVAPFGEQGKLHEGLL